MLRKIFLTLMLMSLKWVDGFQPEPVQLFTPTRIATTELMTTLDLDEILYDFTTPNGQTLRQSIQNVKNYGIPKHPATHLLPVVQYAPLNPPQLKTLAVAVTKTPSNVKEYNLKKAENRKNKNHLEPRVENIDHMKIHKNVHRSFVPGHNVEVVPRLEQNGISNVLYQKFHEYLQTQKVNVPRYNIQNSSKRTQSRHFDIEDHPTSGPIQNTNQKHRMFPDKFASNEKPNEEMLRPKVPRLHLNIARVYGINHLSHQAPESKNFKKNEIKSSTNIRGSRLDETGLFPIDFKKYFPIR